MRVVKQFEQLKSTSLTEIGSFKYASVYYSMWRDLSVCTKIGLLTTEDVLLCKIYSMHIIIYVAKHKIKK